MEQAPGLHSELDHITQIILLGNQVSTLCGVQTHRLGTTAGVVYILADSFGLISSIETQMVTRKPGMTATLRKQMLQLCLLSFCPCISEEADMSQMLSLKLCKSNQNYLHAKLDFLFFVH